jgi:hypothetical protein
MPREQIAQSVERARLLARAARRLFEKRGGLDLELSIAAARRVVQNAMRCRESEARVLDANPDAQRERGERPYVSVSEQRLFIRELKQLNAERNALEQDVREELHRALERMQPRTQGEYRAALDAALGEESDETRGQLMREIEEAAAAGMSDQDRGAMQQQAQAVFGSLAPQQVKEIGDAILRHDYAAVRKIVESLAPEKRKPLERMLSAA